MKKPYIFLLSVIGAVAVLVAGHAFFFSAFSARATTTQAPSPTVDISGTALFTNLGTTYVVVKWSSQNAVSCVASGAWSGTQALSGESSQIPASSGESVYTITCSNAGGSAAASAMVTASGSATSTPASSTPSSTLFDTMIQAIKDATNTQSIISVAQDTGYVAEVGSSTDVSFVVVEDPVTHATIGSFVGPLP
jgi:hypothetical protein